MLKLLAPIGCLVLAYAVPDVLGDVGAALSPGVAKRLTVSPEMASPALGMDVSFPDLAIQAAGGQGPAVVCFLNNEDHPDRRTDRGRLSSIPARNSLSLKQMITSTRIGDFSESLKLFRVFFVDVTAVDPATCPAVNFAKAPFLAVLTPDGKACKVFGPGLPTDQEIVVAMRTALKPKLDLDKFLALERKLVKDTQKRDSLVADIETKRRNHLQKEILQQMEAKADEQAAGLEAQEAAVQALLDAAGLKRY